MVTLRLVSKIEQLLYILWYVPWRGLIQMIPSVLGRFLADKHNLHLQGRTYHLGDECHQVCSGCRLECTHHGPILPN
jgi:hypothetical protein